MKGKVQCQSTFFFLLVKKLIRPLKPNPSILYRAYLQVTNPNPMKRGIICLISETIPPMNVQTIS